MKTHLSTTFGFTLCAALGAMGACGSEALEEEGTAVQADTRSASTPRDLAVRRDPRGGYLANEAGAALETHVDALDDAHPSAEAQRPTQPHLTVNPGEVDVAIPAPWQPGPPPEGPDQP